METIVRKQILITEPQQDYLRSLSDATGQSEGHFVREALELHAKHFNPSSSTIPSLYAEKQTTESKTDELES